jgi:hypothetical protein
VKIAITLIELHFGEQTAQAGENTCLQQLSASSTDQQSLFQRVRQTGSLLRGGLPGWAEIGVSPEVEEASLWQAHAFQQV